MTAVKRLGLLEWRHEVAHTERAGYPRGYVSSMRTWLGGEERA